MSSRKAYSSSAPMYETRMSGRTYASPPPEPYHGRHFQNAAAQEERWNARGSTEVWDPSQPLSSVAARPDTYGLAHSYHEPTLEHKFSDPYEKRPNPYTARTKADYDTYKHYSDGHGEIAKEARHYKNTEVGRNIFPRDYHRDNLMKGKSLAREGRDMANTAVQSRAGFLQKYPQAYENREAISKHIQQEYDQRVSAADFRRTDAFIDRRLGDWKTQVERQGRRP